MDRGAGMFEEEEKEYQPDNNQEVVIAPKDEVEEVKVKEASQRPDESTGKDFLDIGHLADKNAGNAFLVSTFEEELNMDFIVVDPEERGGHIQYYVRGKDRMGDWQGQRRYNHFHALHELLCQRWPGVYLPHLPPKKAIGRYETKFLQERMYFL